MKTEFMKGFLNHNPLGQGYVYAGWVDSYPYYPSLEEIRERGESWDVTGFSEPFEGSVVWSDGNGTFVPA